MKVNISTIFWLFFIIAALQPLLKRRLLLATRQRLITAFEKKRGSRVIVLIHRQETMSLLGFPILRYIDIDDSEEVIRAIHMTDPDIPLDLVLHTPGGLVLASYQIAHAIRMHRGKIRAFVPHYAMSGGTLIALAADEIVMEEHAVLGPVDPQLGEYPASSLVKLAEAKPISDIDDRSWLLADMGRKAIEQIRSQVKSLLEGKYPTEKADELARILTEGRWTHDYPITYEEAKNLGLHVVKDIPPEVYQLMSLYPQPVRHQPSVEYIPIPKFKGPAHKS
ncbi:MAG: ATP-dependent Clp protease proteolytic subunit [Thermodesulfobacteriota bacterium]|jgi:ClpP class serine protease